MVCAALTLPVWTASAVTGPAASVAVSGLAATDSDKLTQVATEFVTSHAAKRRCGLVERLYRDGALGSTPRCVLGLSDDDRSGFSTGAEVDAITIDTDGVRAQAVVTHIGGALDGATGEWGFLKVGKEGPFGGELTTSGTWKIADWSDSYMRSRTAALLDTDYVADGRDDPLASKAARACSRATFAKLDEFNFFVAFTAGFRHDTNHRSGRILGCLHKAAPKAVTWLKRSYRYELARTQTYGGVPIVVARCAVTRTLNTLTNAQIIKAATDFRGGNKMAEKVRAQVKECKG